MSEKLITKVEAAEMLGMKLRTFEKLKAKLIANKGLQMVKVSKSHRFRKASLEKIIKKAAENGTDI